MPANRIKNKIWSALKIIHQRYTIYGQKPRIRGVGLARFSFFLTETIHGPLAPVQRGEDPAKSRHPEALIAGRIDQEEGGKGMVWRWRWK